MSFMRLPDKYSGRDSYFFILPVVYEHSPTFGHGAAAGAEEILKASKHLEYYDEQFDVEPYEEGIHLMQPVVATEPEEMISKMANHQGKFIITLGGDHAVTIGAVQRYKGEFSVIILDAHADFRYSWNDSRVNHACVARNMVNNHKVGIIGVRAMDKDEADEIEKDRRISVTKAYEYSEVSLREMLQNLDERVYVSIDVDVFDPSIIRNTGTPEPGGFNWERVIDILKLIFENKKVIGADIVEFAPKENFRAEAFTLAKLCYKIMALQIKNTKTR